MEILFELLRSRGISGDESETKNLILNYIHKRKDAWKVCPDIFSGDELQDCIILKFGKPRTAVFAHIDTIGFMTRYQNQLVAVGGPDFGDSTIVVGEDSLGSIKCTVREVDGNLEHDFPRKTDIGTCLSYYQDIRIDEEFIQAAYLDNRLGVYNCLKLAENLENGWIVFSTYEEHGGGSVPFLLKFIQSNSPIRQALVSDITWITEGVSHHEGVVISVRDRNIPRRSFINKVIGLARESGIPFQLEVEGSGGSDGREIQNSEYAIDWCFIGAAEDNVHSPNEKVSLKDLDSMLKMYQYLMAKL
ncbi:M20/M25/M40 family metallo-hydrolase [Algoriphagus sediminis]|uniref:M20/M25/M40 family metallo-hydrolase n=1 Tax=Algoriphagus sediminis TaxID=3057113 RepID=A0ABT7YFK6_9BACT|nr:M20/M25/M40 family metallo-hydrolase [Algoriphagus sediminis]MDN3205110.1 M20/M25/M40 family metallo-hydrolase [Algoriphagus sediminis]